MLSFLQYIRLLLFWKYTVVCFPIYYLKPTKNLLCYTFTMVPLQWSIRQLTCAFRMLCSQIKNWLYFSQSFLSIHLLLKSTSNILYLPVSNDAEIHQRFETYSCGSRRLEKNMENILKLSDDLRICLCNSEWPYTYLYALKYLTQQRWILCTCIDSEHWLQNFATFADSKDTRHQEHNKLAVTVSPTNIFQRCS
jgi:hypothetical protein